MIGKPARGGKRLNVLGDLAGTGNGAALKKEPTVGQGGRN